MANRHSLWILMSLTKPFVAVLAPSLTIGSKSALALVLMASSQSLFSNQTI
jgi:hypothetical protein